MIQLEQPLGKDGGTAASLRQIAILLHSLPERTHRVLLGQLDHDEKQRVTSELSALGDIDPLEQHRVLSRMHDALTSETSSVKSVESEIQDEIEIGKARVSKKRSPAVYHSTDVSEASDRKANAEAGAWETGDGDRPAGSHTDGTSTDGPPTEPRRDSMSPVDFAATVTLGSQTDVVAGQAAVQPTPEMLQSMFAQFHQSQAAGMLPATRQGADTALQPSTMRDALVSPSPESASQHLRTGEAAWSDQQPSVLPFHQRSDHVTSHRLDTRDGNLHADESPLDPVELADRVDRFLNELPPETLCRALGKVATKEAFLVLCGLPNETAETVLAMLPRRTARKVRNDMRRMGSLQLSEIDSAKQIVAQVAIRLASQSESLAA